MQISGNYISHINISNVNIQFYSPSDFATNRSRRHQEGEKCAGRVFRCCDNMLLGYRKICRNDCRINTMSSGNASEQPLQVK